jgi:hypothetical protein
VLIGPRNRGGGTLENKAGKAEDIPEDRAKVEHADFDPNVVIFACRH